MQAIVTVLCASLIVAPRLSATEPLTAAPRAGTGPSTPQEAGEEPAFSPEELEQLTAPIALHPDEVVSQILMASSYPLEIVQAERWVTDHKDLKGDKLAATLEEQSWDPSVKSLVNFPEVLTTTSEKLDWTTKLGDAVLNDQEAVLNAVQSLRKRAKEAGQLETTEQQKVVVEETIIKIEPTDPEVIYVPTYNTTVVYGTWPYPTYPPYYYYPPHYPTGAAWGFAAGVAVGVAWGYAWGGCGWHHGHIDIDVDRNININKNIDRDRYRNGAGTGGKGNWKHNPDHRQGVRYRDQATAKKYNRQARTTSTQGRDAYRGRKSASTSNSRSRPGSTGRTGSTPSTRGSSTRGSSRSGGAFDHYSSRSSASRSASRGRISRSSSGRSRGGFRGGRR